MSEQPRPDDAPPVTPATRQAAVQQASAPDAPTEANAAKRRFLIKAMKIGVAVPVVLTISPPGARAATVNTTNS